MQYNSLVTLLGWVTHSFCSLVFPAGKCLLYVPNHIKYKSNISSKSFININCLQATLLRFFLKNDLRTHSNWVDLDPLLHYPPYLCSSHHSVAFSIMIFQKETLFLNVSWVHINVLSIFHYILFSHNVLVLEFFFNSSYPTSEN